MTRFYCYELGGLIFFFFLFCFVDSLEQSSHGPGGACVRNRIAQRHSPPHHGSLLLPSRAMSPLRVPFFKEGIDPQLFCCLSLWSGIYPTPVSFFWLDFPILSADSFVHTPHSLSRSFTSGDLDLSDISFSVLVSLHPWDFPDVRALKALFPSFHPAARSSCGFQNNTVQCNPGSPDRLSLFPVPAPCRTPPP